MAEANRQRGALSPARRRVLLQTTGVIVVVALLLWGADTLARIGAQTLLARNIQDATVSTVQVFSLDAKGKELTVDKTLTIQHGYQSPGANNNNVGRGTDVFVRGKASAKK